MTTALVFKRCLWRFPARKLYGFDPETMLKLLFAYKLCDEKGYGCTISLLWRYCESYAYGFGFRNVMADLETFHSKDLMKRYLFGKQVKNRLKPKYRYSPSVAGRNLVNEFWEFYKSQCELMEGR